MSGFFYGVNCQLLGLKLWVCLVMFCPTHEENGRIFIGSVGMISIVIACWRFRTVKIYNGFPTFIAGVVKTEFLLSSSSTEVEKYIGQPLQWKLT